MKKRTRALIGMGIGFVLLAVVTMKMPTGAAITSAASTPSPSCGPTAAGCVRFAVIGDFGDQTNNNGAPEANVATVVKSWSPQFIITVGDNNYNCGTYSTIVANNHPYCDYIYNPGAIYYPNNNTSGPSSSAVCTGTANSNKVNAFFPAMGNHEWYTTNATPYFMFYTGLPNNPYASGTKWTNNPSGTLSNQRYYDFTWKTRDNQTSPVHLFAIDSEDPQAYEKKTDCGINSKSDATFEPDGATEKSVQYNWYKSAVGSATEAWKIAYFHHAPWACNNGSDNSPWMQWDFKGLGTNVVLAGHKHVYQRYVKSTSQDHPYITNGTSGTSLTSKCQKLGSNFKKEKYIVGKYGALMVEATATTITFYYYTTTNGSSSTLSDWIQVTKNNSGGQTMTCSGC